MNTTRELASVTRLAALIAGLAATSPAQNPVSAICLIDGDCSVSLSYQYETLTFTNKSAATTLTLPLAVPAEILVVAGGGGGGSTIGGGGGAGGVIYTQVVALAAGTYTVNVGAGGPGASTYGVQGSNGYDTSMASEPFILTATGGGGGGGWTVNNGKDGGSGGGASGGKRTSEFIGKGTDGQGHDGAICGTGLGFSGGGGGAGEPGEEGGATLPDHGGYGGDGIACDITGKTVYYGGGGGAGAGHTATYGGHGGLGGGGNGSDRNSGKAGLPGMNGLGGGGGGGSYSPGTSGGSGGSGIAIIRLDLSDIIAVYGNPGNFGEALPAYGGNDVEPGLVSCSVSPVSTNAALDTIYTCTGGVMSVTYATGVVTNTHFSGSAYDYSHTPGCLDRLTWFFKRTFKITFSPTSGEGDVPRENDGWYDEGSSVTLTPAGGVGYEFYRWTAGVPDENEYDTPYTFTCDGPATFSAQFTETPSGMVLYVKTDGSDDAAGTSWTNAFKTIKHAIEAANLADGAATIYVSEGTYTEELGAKITNAVTVVGVDGFELTTIKPSASTLTPVITLDHPDCRLTDFTISGYACPHAGETANATIAGPIKISTKGGKVDHCLFKGNVSKTNYTRGYAIMLYGGLMEQCVVRDNNITYTTAYAPVYINGGSAEVEMRNCLVTHNGGRSDTVYVEAACAKGAVIRNCTIAGNYAHPGETGYIAFMIGNQVKTSAPQYNYVENVVVENTIISGNAGADGTPTYGYPDWTVSNDTMTNQFVNCIAPVAPNGTCIAADPQFSDPDTYDYSLLPSSPAIDAGIANGLTEDCSGLVARPSGSGIDIGAYECDQSILSMSFFPDVPYAFAGTPFTLTSVTLGASDAENLVYNWSVTNTTTGTGFTGSNLSLTAAEPPAGLYTATLTVTDNGVSPAQSVSYSLAEPVSRTPVTMYVTPGNTANEVFPYDTPETGAAKIPTAYKHAVDGTTLMLGAGIHTLTVQLIVHKGVRFIGNGENRSAVIKQTSNMERVLYVDNADAWFENVTITGGYKSENGSYGGELRYSRGQDGSGVCITADGGTLYDCAISNNQEKSIYVHGGGVGMRGGRVARCLLADNRLKNSTYTGFWGAGAFVGGNGILENCVIVDNTVKDHGAVAIEGASAVVRNCTVYGNNTLSAESGGLYYTSGTVMNCAFYNNTNATSVCNIFPSSAASSANIQNCASTEVFGSDDVVCADPLFTDPSARDFSIPSQSMLRNRGRNYEGAAETLDYIGNPRVFAGRPDIGAYECQKIPATMFSIR